MHLYAAGPVQAARQVLVDVGVLVWVALWCVVGRFLYDLVMALTTPVRYVARAGRDFESTLRETGRSVREVPLAGERLDQAFQAVAGSGGRVATASTDLESTISAVAWGIAVVTVVSPILLVVVPWLARRIGFARRAHAGRRVAASEGGIELFALRALATQPLPALTGVHPDVAGAWRRGERDVIERLAALEMRASGIRPPGVDTTRRLPAPG